MQISENVHALKIDFQIPLPGNKFLNRFVYAYIISNGKITLIDSGVKTSVHVIVEYIEKLGQTAKNIPNLILTHAHPDHIGGAKEIQSLSGCKIQVHSSDAAWIEDIEVQFKARPVPGFYNLVGGSVTADIKLNDDDIINDEIKVLHTPGHSNGNVALLYMKDAILFSGDAIPMKNDMPIYSDPLDTINSIKKMKDIKGIKFLLSSWDAPRCGDEIPYILDEGIDYIKNIHHKVMAEKQHSDDIMVVARNTWNSLGLPEFAFNQLFVKTVEGHLKYEHPI
jgi:hydroxyacylglutathione hydrolase